MEPSGSKVAEVIAIKTRLTDRCPDKKLRNMKSTCSQICCVSNRYHNLLPGCPTDQQTRLSAMAAGETSPPKIVQDRHMQCLDILFSAVTTLKDASALC